MKNIALLFLAALMGLAGFARDKGKVAKYQKILVLAKVEQPGIKKQFEDAMVKSLKDKGYHAIPSYANITADDLTSAEKLSARADSLQIDALLAYTVLGVETTVKNTPQVSANVGVPVRIGFMSVYVGGSVPLGGGPKQEKTVRVKAGFYNQKNSPEPSWSMELTGSLSNGTDAVVYDFVKKSAKALFKQKVL